MLKTASLGRYWQDGSDGSSFTRVRCISSGNQTTPRIYGSIKFKTSRANSVPDASTGCKKFLKFRKSSLMAFGSPVLVERRSKEVRELGRSYSSTSTSSTASIGTSSNHSLCEVEGGGGGGGGGRLLVCTLDTEQNERSLSSSSDDDRDSFGGRSHSRNGSVEMMTAKSIINTVTSSSSNSTTGNTTPATLSNTCCGCGNSLENSDMVVEFDEDMYHLKCFVCGQCKSQVNPSTNFLVLDDGSPLCADCSPICHACQEKVLCGHVNVLNKDFHEGCLKCSVCNKVSSCYTIPSCVSSVCVCECILQVLKCLQHSVTLQVVAILSF